MGVLVDEGDVPDLFQRMNAAIGQINRLDPALMHRMQGNIRRVAIAPRGVPSYLRRHKTILLPSGHVRRWHKSQLASTLVHEMVHAWLDNRGLPATTAASRSRVEQTCIKAQLRLARRFQDNAGMIEDLNQHLQYWRGRVPETSQRCRLSRGSGRVC